MTLFDGHPSPESHTLSAPAGGEIVAVANAATATSDHSDELGELVVVARTGTGEHRAVGGGQRGSLRAAISVAVASGNTRLWDGASGSELIEHPVRALPEVVRAAAEACGVTSAYVGCIEDESIAAVAVWFAIDGQVASPTRREETMAMLTTAAQRQAEFFAARDAAAESAPAAASDAAADDGGRTFDPADPGLDSDTGLATRDRFEDAMENYDSDEATLVVVDLDGFAAVADEFGEDITHEVLREIADRLVSSCRKDDLIARIGPDTFAILFAEAPRSVGLHVAKRLLDTIALPLSVENGPAQVTATVALAHQFGLVDMDELFESADDAVASGKRKGAGHLIIAS